MIQFTDEQRIIKDTVRQLATDKIAHLAKDADESGHTSPEIIDLLAGIDLLSMALPDEYGGIDANYTTTAAIELFRNEFKRFREAIERWKLPLIMK
jgi:alkylation response protein AidB-like acyl-CoA dehydrogenase